MIEFDDPAGRIQELPVATAVLSDGQRVIQIFEGSQDDIECAYAILSSSPPPNMTALLLKNGEPAKLMAAFAQT